MRLYNKSKRTYQHTYFNTDKNPTTISLNPRCDAEIPDEVAELWLKIGEVVEYVDPQKAKKVQADLEAENAKLKAELKALKKTIKK